MSIGDIVLIHDEDHPRIFWKMGKVEDLIMGAEGVIRGAMVCTQIWKQFCLAETSYTAPTSC